MTLNENQSALWEKLASFQIDEPGQILGFRGRLARENGWSPQHTHRVVEEYRKFIFLCFATEHPCSPSDEVDQAWHLHLTYTRSYWERLCGEVLPGPLHHEPTKGGAEESAKFDEWYERTLDSYRRLFGSEPPIDIWPPTERRFLKQLPERKPDECWMIPKARSKRAFAFLGLMSLATTGAIGCGETVDTDTIIPILMLAGFAVVILLLVTLLPNKGWQRRGDSSGTFDFSGWNSDGGYVDSHHSSGHDAGSHGDGGHGGHGCGGHGCGGHGCGGHGCGGGCGGGGH